MSNGPYFGDEYFPKDYSEEEEEEKKSYGLVIISSVVGLAIIITII